MDRLIGVVVLALVAVAALPAVVAAAQAAIPFLLSLLFFLGIARLLWPTRRRRRG
jgi:hypothetical protein